jgi:hypothetical protein
MHESAPIPPDPESERRGHEMRDVAIRPILIFLIVLFVTGGLLETVMSTIMRGFVIEDTKVGVPGLTVEDVRTARTEQRTILHKTLSDHGDVGDNIHQAPAPALQRDTTGDMLEMYKQENALLNAYVKDTKTGQIRIPIDRAIEILATKKKLPYRDTPADKIDKELPYPKRSTPYMATP